MINKAEIIGEVALRCGDSDKKDFSPSIYEQAYYRANRSIAKLYQILQKTLFFTLSDVTDSLIDDIVLNISDFNSEILVKVNNIPLKKVGQHFQSTDKFVYYLERRRDDYLFNYILGEYVSSSSRNIDITELMNTGITERTDEQLQEAAVNKGLNDDVTIVYNIIPDHYTDTEGEFVIPSRYEEEIIKETISYLAKIGVVRFAGSQEKMQKYTALLRMYRPMSDKDKQLLTSNEFIKMKPFRFPDEV